MERVEIIEDFKAGRFDVLVGVNLLREGLDIPSVSLVAILDADKEGFLRSERSLTQTAGRAARNVNGLVIMYADKITDSMQSTIDETNRRRKKQQEYNKAHGITPKQVLVKFNKLAGDRSVVDGYNSEIQQRLLAEDPVVSKMDAKSLHSAIKAAQRKMESAAAELNFIEAAKYRDEMNALKKIYDGKDVK
jgi:excinuclease ABC subunit B